MEGGGRRGEEFEFCLDEVTMIYITHFYFLFVLECTRALRSLIILNNTNLPPELYALRLSLFDGFPRSPPATILLLLISFSLSFATASSLVFLLARISSTA
jgi:hypothetical protein